MIIKDKPFRVPSSSCVQCAFYFPAAVVGYADRPRGYSDLDYASLLRWCRRGPGFSRLEAYQVRLSRYLVMRRSDAVFDRRCDAHFDTLLEDYLEAGRAGGVW
jgi:hypothetical protein